MESRAFRIRCPPFTFCFLSLSRLSFLLLLLLLFVPPSCLSLLPSSFRHTMDNFLFEVYFFLASPPPPTTNDNKDTNTTPSPP
ncbi:hypothetical protein F5H01DRAFT_344648 [Linnemannia elongata]|nr:hypothetical protein F5H01DRAFT_344648 [Linnemannia elongata]